MGIGRRVGGLLAVAAALLNQIPSARAGHLVIIEDKGLASAFSSGSTLGTRSAIEQAVPLFAEATR